MLRKSDVIMSKAASVLRGTSHQSSTQVLINVAEEEALDRVNGNAFREM